MRHSSVETVMLGRMLLEPVSDLDARETALTDVQRHTIRDAVLMAMNMTFGVWQSKTTKAFRWTIVDDILDVALLAANCGTLVIPFQTGTDCRPYFGEVAVARFDAGRVALKTGRSTNLAHKSHSTLWWDRDLVYLRPMTSWELARSIQIIVQKRNGVPIEDQRPPSNDTPLAALGFDGASRFGGGIWSRFRAVFDRDKGRCRMCGRNENLHIDHIIPRARGGSDDLENLWLLCRECNLSKSDTI